MEEDPALIYDCHMSDGATGQQVIRVPIFMLMKHFDLAEGAYLAR